ncbi:hypothetical protein KI387_000615 [Taxus chinensis]|uniref:Uncharacterized protein n=1 Tax=Taxus chinensis TaxID=29808 RepID=A0AA38LP63_TAXCH|nr:hypothetical protein KI387_000615 [Taxus chinensis]
MKKGVSANLVKQIWSAVRGAVKTKSNSLKEKAADAMKAKVVVLGLIKNKKIFKTIRHKMDVLFHSHQEEESRNSMALAVFGPAAAFEEKFDLHPAELDYLSNTVLELPRNSICSMLADGPISACTDLAELEDEIDDLADIFIRRFHAQMRFQKQSSFKLYQEMLDRSV